MERGKLIAIDGALYDLSSNYRISKETMEELGDSDTESKWERRGQGDLGASGVATTSEERGFLPGWAQWTLEKLEKHITSRPMNQEDKARFKEKWVGARS